MIRFDLLMACTNDQLLADLAIFALGLSVGAITLWVTVRVFG